jgi:predicted SAM-dependent methyltransferase
MVAEHVFEHLDDLTLEKALLLCRRYLKTDGRLRIAVPDGYRPDGNYLDQVRPPADGHHQLFTIDSISELLEQVGFRVEPLEYYDRDHVFHRRPWDDSEGFVYRCYGRDTQEEFRFRDHYYTSIIVDARPIK